MACGKWIEQRIFSFNLPNIVKINECQCEMSTAPQKIKWKRTGGSVERNESARARSSCNIINNLFSGHIFIPHAIITLSLPLHTSERPHACPMMCKSKARTRKKTRNETYRRKMRLNLWNGSQSRGLQHPGEKKMRRKQEEEAIVVHWCGRAHGFFINVHQNSYAI